MCGQAGRHLETCEVLRAMREGEHRGRMRALQEAAQVYGRHLDGKVLVKVDDLRKLAALFCAREEPCKEGEPRCTACHVAQWAQQTLRSGA